MKGACCIVIRRGRYLVQRRSRKGGFVYEFPCGKVDENESYEQAAIRELMEETGLGASLAGPIHEISDGDFIMGFVPLKISDDVEPQIIDSRRQQTFYWLLPEEIPIDGFSKVCRQYVLARGGDRGRCFLSS